MTRITSVRPPTKRRSAQKLPSSPLKNTWICISALMSKAKPRPRTSGGSLEFDRASLPETDTTINSRQNPPRLGRLPGVLSLESHNANSRRRRWTVFSARSYTVMKKPIGREALLQAVRSAIGAAGTVRTGAEG
jgi:hypothetical protein